MKFKKAILLTLPALILTTSLSATGLGGPITFGTKKESLPKEEVVKEVKKTFNVDKADLERHFSILNLIRSGELKKAYYEADLFHGDVLNRTGNNDLVYSLALITIGEVAKAYGDYQKALKYHEKAFLNLDLIKRKNMLDYTLAAQYIVDTMLLAGFPEKARKYAKEAHDYIQLNFSKSSKEMGDSFFLLGKVENYREELKKANNYFWRAENIFKKTYGVTSFEMAMISYEKAMGFMNTGAFKECIIQLTETEKILAETFEKKYPLHQIFGQIKRLKGYSYIGEFKFDLAIQEYNKALDIFNQLLDPENEIIADILSNQAVAQKNLGEFEEALVNNFKAVDIIKKKKGENSASLIDIYQNIGQVYYEKRDYEKAISYMKLALEVNIENYGSFHTTTKIIKGNLDFIERDSKYEWR